MLDLKMSILHSVGVFSPEHYFVIDVFVQMLGVSKLGHVCMLTNTSDTAKRFIALIDDSFNADDICGQMDWHGMEQLPIFCGWRIQIHSRKVCGVCCNTSRDCAWANWQRKVQIVYYKLD